jgi:hypothetical protein
MSGAEGSLLELALRFLGLWLALCAALAPLVVAVFMGEGRR